MRDFFDLCPPEWIAGFNKSELRVTLRNGSELYFRPFDDERTVRGLTVGFVAVDEWSEVPEATTRTLRGRLRLAGVVGHKMFGCSNPGGRDHYLYRDFVDPATRLPGNSYVFSSSLENLFTPPEYRVDLLRAFGGQQFRRFVLGEWCDFEGRVWPSYDPHRSFLDARDLWLDPVLPRDRAIDFGFKHAFVCLWGAWVGPRRLVVYREYVATERSLEEHASAIAAAERDEPRGFHAYRTTWSDHDEQDRFELARMRNPALRIVTQRAKKDFRAGITSVEAGFRAQDDGQPGIFISSACPILHAQVLGYRYPDKIRDADPDAVVTHDAQGRSIDDACDALRYLWFSRVGETFRSEPSYAPELTSIGRAHLYRTTRLQGVT